MLILLSMLTRRSPSVCHAVFVSFLAGHFSTRVRLHESSILSPAHEVTSRIGNRTEPWELVRLTSVEQRRRRGHIEGRVMEQAVSEFQQMVTCARKTNPISLVNQQYSDDERAFPCVVWSA